MTTNTTIEPTGPDTHSPATRTRRSKRSLVARVAAVVFAAGTLAGTVGIAGVSPAQAATGTTYQKVCAYSGYAGTAAPTITAYWWNGSSWVSQGSARATCVNFTLVHNGYWYYNATTYLTAPCIQYYWRYTSPTAFIKQNLPASSTVSVTMNYTGSLATC